ncbi:hypothetical protein ACIOWK_32400 [Pseudomonas protegens]|uniref:hypothetical protein n=1 Tax=Pseudomonas protegens TaxID=380021 RepID=UPI0038224AC8
MNDIILECRKAAEGHILMANMIPDDPRDTVERLVCRIEMHKRGLRFLPRHAEKRIIRRALQSK